MREQDLVEVGLKQRKEPFSPPDGRRGESFLTPQSPAEFTRPRRKRSNVLLPHATLLCLW